MSGSLPHFARGSRWLNHQSQRLKAQRDHEICGAPEITAFLYLQLVLIRRLPTGTSGWRSTSLYHINSYYTFRCRSNRNTELAHSQCHTSLHIRESYSNLISLQVVQKRETHGKFLPVTFFCLYLPQTPSTIMLCAMVHAIPFSWSILLISLHLASFVSFRAQLGCSLLCEGFANHIHWAAHTVFPCVPPWPISVMVRAPSCSHYLFTCLSTQLACEFSGQGPRLTYFFILSGWYWVFFTQHSSECWDEYWKVS